MNSPDHFQSFQRRAGRLAKAIKEAKEQTAELYRLTRTAKTKAEQKRFRKIAEGYQELVDKLVAEFAALRKEAKENGVKV